MNPRGYKNSKPAEWTIPASMAPGIPNNIALAGNVSAGVTLPASAAGGRLRITCSVDCQYRVSSGASTAASTDNDLPANTPEYITLLNNQDTITFYSAAAGTAKVALCGGAST